MKMSCCSWNNSTLVILQMTSHITIFKIGKGIQIFPLDTILYSSIEFSVICMHVTNAHPAMHSSAKFHKLEESCLLLPLLIIGWIRPSQLKDSQNSSARNFLNLSLSLVFRWKAPRTW